MRSASAATQTEDSGRSKPRPWHTRRLAMAQESVECAGALGLGRLPRAAAGAPPGLPRRVRVPVQPPAHARRRLRATPGPRRHSPTRPVPDVDQPELTGEAIGEKYPMAGNSAPAARIRRGRPGAQDTDRHVGAMLRARRIALGLTQQQLAERVGITYQQAHKYETGINRISAGRL